MDRLNALLEQAALEEGKGSAPYSMGWAIEGIYTRCLEVLAKSLNLPKGAKVVVDNLGPVKVGMSAGTPEGWLLTVQLAMSGYATAVTMSIYGGGVDRREEWSIPMPTDLLRQARTGLAKDINKYL